MPNLNVPFAGQTLIIPGAYYNDNVSAVIPNPVPTTPPLILIGNSYGQKPFVPTTYSTPQNLLAAIRGGPVSGFVPFLTNPSPAIFGAQQITLINVSNATTAALTLQSGTSGVVVLTSANYGLPSNLLQASVAAGTVAGKNVTLFDGYSSTQAVGVNLGVPFSLAYTGAATGVTYTVAVSGGIATTFSTSSPNAGESVNVSLSPSNYGTIESLVQYLNGTGFYSAQIVSNGALPSTNLDAAAAVALTSGATNVTATLGDIVYWVNNNSQGLATAALSSGITSSSGVAPTNIPLTPFSGATSPAPTLANYASGFNAALATPGWAVFADSNTSGVIALGAQHAISASSPSNGKYRRFFSGSTVGDSVATTIANAALCNSTTSTFVYPGIYAVNTATGINTLYSGLYAAAAVAGMATGNAPAVPLTNKPLNGTGVEIALTTSQINQLQQSGVMPLFVPSPTAGVPTIVSDFTTWLNDSNPENVFNQQVACRQFLAYSVINICTPYIGTVATPLQDANILKALAAGLNALLYNSGNSNGVLAAWDPNSLTLTYNGAQQLAAVTMNVVLVGQNRFITVQTNVLPLNFTIQNAVQNPA